MHLAAPEREPVNGWLHFCGAVLAAAGLVALTAQALGRDSLRHLVGAVVFGGSATLLFACSSLYHLRPASPRQQLYSCLDHSMIYVFIAGTYTPICLVALWPSLAGRLLLGLVWAIALLGVVRECAPNCLPRGFAVAIYLGLGWIGVLAAPLLLRVAPPGLFAWLLAGGAIYTVGALVYWRKWPRGRPGVFGFHELWHTCVLLASASHWWAIVTYVLPLR